VNERECVMHAVIYIYIYIYIYMTDNETDIRRI
jgi:hypothetical protein